MEKLVLKENIPIFVRRAYDLSRAVGMGVMHFQPGPLPEEMLQKILSFYTGSPSKKWFDMDYVMGRAIKINLDLDGNGNVIIPDGWEWYRHSPVDTLALLDGITVDAPEANHV